MCLILQLRIITEDENKEEPEENIPIVDGVPVEENNVEDGDNGDDDEIQEVDNTMDSLQQGLEMMNLGNRPSNLPPTTPGLFVIPPRSYLNVAEGRRYVRIRILGPSGITEDRSVFQVLHSGWTLRLRFYYPDWFLNPQIVLQADDYLRISDAEVTAFDDGVLMLRETDQERPFNDWIVALPIRVEQHLRPDDVEFIARATEGHDG